MDVKELMTEINALNSQVEHYNSLRSKNIGKKETLEHQCEALLKKYEETYGVHLTPETLDVEFEKVLSEKSHEAKLLSDVLDAIKAGKYDHANALMGVKADEQPVYDTTSFSQRKNEIQHGKFEVTSSESVVTTEMERKDAAIALAQRVVSAESQGTGANFATSNTSVTTPVEVAAPKSIVAPMEDDDDDFVPKMSMPSTKPVHAKPVIKAPMDDFDDQIPTKGMSKAEAPMDALEGFTAPRQAAPTPNMFDSAPVAPKKPKALSFEDMFGSAFKK